MLTRSVCDSLEYSKVLPLAAKYCITESGKTSVINSKPFIELDKVVREGQIVSEAKEVIIKSNLPPIEYIPDMSEDLALSRIEGALLSEKKILNIFQLLVISRNVYSFIKNNNEEIPNLKEVSSNIHIDKILENHIVKIISENGEIRDSASQKLAQIRKEIRVKNDDLIRIVNKITKDYFDKEFVREEYITLRDGRVVLPVKAEHKRHVRGFIHSESATGQTVYIEPEETLQLNNEIVSLSFAEKREIEKILKELTKRIGESSYNLETSLYIISYLDSIFARAQYSIGCNGSFPQINNDKPFEILNGRHPLLLHKLGKDKTVPLSLKIDNNRVIVITGPNAGGKTVVLKTVGLFALLVQSGFHIPCSPDSNFHIFTNILLDIGDQQSIEDDLSTFSSHLSNIKKMLENADANSLVLLDEIGTGTDPAAGSALAASILITLRDKNSLVFSTTHHGSLKTLAHEHSGFENASMEFDTAALQPTYYFRQGTPGSSYAFEIAKRLGFSDDLLSLAKQHVSVEENKLESILVELEKQTQVLNEKLKLGEIEKTRYEELAKLYSEKLSSIEKDKKKILKETKDKASEIIENAKKTTQALIKEIKEKDASKEVIKSTHNKIVQLKIDTEKIFKDDVVLMNKNFNFTVNNFVRVRDTSTAGKIVSINKEKNTATIVSGSLKLQVKLSELLPEKEVKAKFSEFTYIQLSDNDIDYRLDIRGGKPEDAEFEIIKFIDTAYMNGLQQIEILHGKGTGVLKKTVHLLLKEHEKVKNYYFAKIEFGGEGITVVELN